MTKYRLFHELANRYDLHTPAHHYQDDQTFVLSHAKRYPSPRLLDVGCGTGILVQRARAEGVEAFGIDASPEMVAVAEQRVGPQAVRVQRMEDLSEAAAYDVITCLSWSLNHVADEVSLLNVLRRFHDALRPGGSILLQSAHASHASGEVYEDRETGPTGEPDDIVVLYQFEQVVGAIPPELLARYVYACISERVLVHEDHALHVADAELVASLARQAGFLDVRLYESWRADPFSRSVMPFVVGTKAS